MFDEIFGIPAHPLLVHSAVVFVPLQVGVAIAYAVVPFARRHLWWLVGGLAVAAPAAAFFAKLSGEEFRERESVRGTIEVNPELGRQITEHQDFADLATWNSVGLGVLMLAMLAVHLGPARRKRTAAPAASAATAAPAAASAATGPDETAAPATSARVNPVVALILSVLVIGVGLLTGYFMFRTGHSGATTVWQGM